MLRLDNQNTDVFNKVSDLKRHRCTYFFFMTQIVSVGISKAVILKLNQSAGSAGTMVFDQVTAV